jgi:hypothetical protein
MNPHQYTVPALTLDEVATTRTALKSSICAWMKWRHQGQWREIIRGAISAYRKLQQTEVAP